MFFLVNCGSHIGDHFSTKIDQKIDLFYDVLWTSIFVRFWTHFGSILGPIWGPVGVQNRSKIDQNRFFALNREKYRILIDFWFILGPFWDHRGPPWGPFWGYLEPKLVLFVIFETFGHFAKLIWSYFSAGEGGGRRPTTKMLDFCTISMWFWRLAKC